MRKYRDDDWTQIHAKRTNKEPTAWLQTPVSRQKQTRP